ncbi:MAG: thioredoxin family protein, partial [Phycisphaerales bacterium JB061]
MHQSKRSFFMLMHALSALLIGLVVLTGAARAEPEVFSKAGFEADRQAAIEQGKLHLVYVRSESCSASGVLESRRLIKPDLISWVEANGVVTKVGVNDSESQAKQLGVIVTPTLIVFRGDEELGRAHGAWWVDDLVQWLEHLRT